MDAPDANQFGYELHREGGHAVVALHGDLDMASAPELVECLHRLSASHAMHVTIDLADLGFCDSSGLATFVRFRQEAERSGCALVLRSPQPNVRQLFELTRTNRLLMAR